VANITTELLGNNTVRVVFIGRQGQHVRLTNSWTDWMLTMDDFRDLIIPLRKEDVDSIIERVINNSNRLRFTNTAVGQEYNLNSDKKIVRRVGPGRVRNEYQGVALFIKNDAQRWPPEPVKIRKREILLLIRAMITLDCPANQRIADSLRNLQYLLSMLWLKKKNPKLLQGSKRPKADEIFRISLVK